MRPATLGIHGSLPDETVFLSSLHQLQAIHVMGDGVLSEALHEDPIKLGLMDIESFGFGEVLKQVVDLLIINLEEGAVDSEFGLGFFLGFDLVEQFKNGPGNQACEVLVRGEILEESILALGVQIFRY